MFLHHGKYVCLLCGAEIEVPKDERPLVTIKASSGKPNIRAIILRGRELHSCPMSTAWQKRADRGSGEP